MYKNGKEKRKAKETAVSFNNCGQDILRVDNYLFIDYYWKLKYYFYKDALSDIQTDGCMDRYRVSS